MNNINLDINKILDKKFQLDFKGYNQKEVDDFLDLVLSDYAFYNKDIIYLKNKIKDLNMIIRLNAVKIAKLKNELQIKDENIKMLESKILKNKK